MGPERHERLGPSTSSRWLACPFSAQLDLPQTPHKTADLGKRLHSVSAEILMGRDTIESVPPTWQEGVQMYVDHVHGNGGEYLVEHFWESMTIPEFGGTADATVIKDNKCAVYDLKTGKWNVEAEGNTQLLCYLAIADEHHDIDEFYGVIVQPKAYKGDKIKVAEFSALEVDDFRERVRDASTAAHKGTGDHCRFCPLRPTCKEGGNYAWEMGWR